MYTTFYGYKIKHFQSLSTHNNPSTLFYTPELKSWLRPWC